MTATKKRSIFDKVAIACLIAIYPLTFYLWTFDFWGDPPRWVLFAVPAAILLCIITMFIGIARSPNTIRTPKGKRKSSNKEFYHDGKNLHITIKNYKSKRWGSM